MEQRVTTYSQYSISANVNNIRNIEAQSLAGISVQKIYFQPDVNIDLAIAAGEFYEMQTFAQSLIELVLSERVDRETAANSATNRHDFLVALEVAEKQAGHYSEDDDSGKQKSSNVSSLGAGLR